MTQHFRKLIAAAALVAAGTAAHAQPANDSCANAIPVANHSITPFDTTDSTRDGEVSCSNFGNDVDVWFSYTAAGAEWVTIDTCASPYNAALATSFGVRLGVFSGCGGTLLGCTDAGSCGTPYIGVGYKQAQMTFTTTGPGTYLICVKGFLGSLGPGVLTLHSTPVATPANNDCGNATVVVDGNNSVDNRNATLDTPCPCTRGGPSFAGPDVWYSYTAPETGVRNFSITQALRLNGAAADTILAIYSGCGGTLLACDDDANGGNLSKIYHFPVTAGTEYKIQVATWGVQSFRQPRSRLGDVTASTL